MMTRLDSPGGGGHSHGEEGAQLCVCGGRVMSSVSLRRLKDFQVWSVSRSGVETTLTDDRPTGLTLMMEVRTPGVELF